MRLFLLKLLILFFAAASYAQAEPLEVGAFYILKQGGLGFQANTVLQVTGSDYGRYSVQIFRWQYDAESGRHLRIPAGPASVSGETDRFSLSKLGTKLEAERIPQPNGEVLFRFFHEARNRHDWIRGALDLGPAEPCPPAEGLKKEVDVVVEKALAQIEQRDLKDLEKWKAEIYENLGIYQELSDQLVSESYRTDTPENQKRFAGELFRRLKSKPEFQGERGSDFFEVLNLWLEFRGESLDSPVYTFAVSEVVRERVRKNPRGHQKFAPQFGDFGDWLSGTPATAVLDEGKFSDWNIGRKGLGHVLRLEEINLDPAAQQVPDSRAMHKLIEDFAKYRTGRIVVAEDRDWPRVDHYYSPQGMKPAGSIPWWADNAFLTRRANPNVWVPKDLPPILDLDSGTIYNFDKKNIVAGTHRARRKGDS